MAKGKQISSEDRAKVIEAKINNPDLSTRDIEKELGVNRMTANRIINDELGQVVPKSTTIAKLIDRNNKLHSLADGLIEEMIIAKSENITVAQLVSLRESTFKQNQLVTGGSTERLSLETQDIDKKDLNEIHELIKSKLK